MIIAFTGYAGSGKDTAAQILIDKYGFEKKCFADAVREAMETMNPIIAMVMATDESGDNLYYRYNEAVRDCGYVEAKRQFPEIRRFMQAFATDWARDTVYDDFWVTHFEVENHGALTRKKNIVITDMRFSNEEDMIRQYDGLIIRVSRLGFDSDGHRSENSIDLIDYDCLVENDGSIDQLHQHIENIIQFFELESNE